MTISYNWLKEYINTDISADRAAEILTAAGLEIESVEHVESIRGGLAGLVVGRVVSCEKHPDADKLSLTRVDIGAADGDLQIVCGAPNVAKGQSVIVATVGTKLYPTGETDGFSIKRSKIRGVESFGMICAEDEIGIGTSHDGIIVLDEKLGHKPGTPAAEVFNLGGDTIFEVGLTPNRVDGASHYGVARDLAASLSLIKGSVLKAVLPYVINFNEGSSKLKVEVLNHEAAPRYMGVSMSGIKIAPSPEWLQTKLRAIGINPKNNVVDITNFVLHECGAPLHAFDLDKVEGREIIVRTVDAGTKFTTLDGVERTLAADDLMICSATRPMCMAGVFGGADSGVSDSTTSIFIESAYFEPAYVRRTAKRHGLSTDSSWRYERGADPEMLPYALKRCAMLISELAGGKVDSEIVDIYPSKIDGYEVIVDLDRINALLGKEIPEQIVTLILSALEIVIKKRDGRVWDLIVPTYRVDVQREADVAEEILRIYGFNNVENPPFIKNVLTEGNPQTTDKMVSVISNMLSSRGLNETMSNSLTRSAYYENLTQMSLCHAVKILNPLSQDLNVMRQTLLFNMLESIAMNSNRKNSDLKLYEVGNCYFHNPAPESAGDLLKSYHQEQHLAIAVCGKWSATNWNEQVRVSNFFNIKDLVEKIFDRFGLNFNEGTLEEAPDNELFEPSVSAVYTIRREKLFVIGQVALTITEKMDIKIPVYYAEIDIEKLQKLVNTVRVKVSELSKFQPISRDLALLVDQNVTFAQLREAAMKAERKLIKSVSLFDVYTGDKLPFGKKSYALNFIIEDNSKTLTDTEIDRIMSSVLASSEKLGATLRA